MFKRILCATAMVATFFVPSVSAESYQSMDVFDIEYPSNPVYGPDGKMVYFQRISMDVFTDQSRSHIWKINTKSGQQFPVLEASTYALSPAGDKIAYVDTANGKAQLFVKWLASGETLELTQLENAPKQLAFSPDGQHLAFTSFVPSKPHSYVTLPRAPEGAEWEEPAKIITEGHYRADGVGFLKPGFSHVFIVSALGGNARQLTGGDFNHGSRLSFSEDGKSLFFSANRHEDNYMNPLNTDIYQLDIASKKLVALTDRIGPDNSPLVSPNGKWIAFTGFDDKKVGYQNSGLYLMKIDGSEKRLLTGKLDRSVADISWSEDSKSLYFKYDDTGDTVLAKISLKGKLVTLNRDLGGTGFGRPYTNGDYAINSQGDAVFTFSDPQRPAELALLKRGSKKLDMLTSMNADAFEHKSMATIEELWVESTHDGEQVQGWIAKPANFDPNKKYPLILEIHGGPFAAYGPHFSPEVQLFASAGYMVLYMNPRGSTSYGDHFANLIHHNYPGNDYDDLMTGVDAVIEQGYVDQNKLFVTGGSGGGVLTSWIIGKTDRFKAAVVAKPVINWLSFTLYSDISAFVSQYWFEKMPWDDPLHYWQRSPLSLVGNVKTPTMLLTGEADYRTPIVETEQYFQALKLQGIETMMVRIPNASHGITHRPSNLISKVAHIIKWFDEHGGKEEE